MRVSVVTISLNQSEFLERALRSVLEQDHPDIEYVIVDGGSIDGSIDILQSYRERLAQLVVENDEGPADALNKGFRRCTGDICACINADDALLPGAIAEAVRSFEANPHADVVYAHGLIVDSTGHPIRRFYSMPFSRRKYAYGTAVVMQQSTFFRRSAFMEVGGFNPQNRTNWDGELLLDLALAGKRFHRVDAYWSLFSIHPASISGSQTRADEYAAARRRLFEKAIGRAPRRSDVLLVLGARVWKWVRHPAVLLARLVDLVRTPEIPT
jgi:glycosyltransferase involved in cell wall biosynthesis